MGADHQAYRSAAGLTIALVAQETLNKTLECGLSNGSAFQFNWLQKRLSQPTDLFSASLGRSTLALPRQAWPTQHRMQAALR